MSWKTCISCGRWVGPAAVFLVVLGAELWLVAAAGSDIPFYDQWDVEGGWLYPLWRAGTLRPGDLWLAHHEHRIVWTHLLNLGLFAVNGQWDPLVQMAAGAVLRAAAAATLARMLGRALGALGRAGVAAGVTLAFLPHIAFNNVLWGFQSQVYFVLLFSVIALACLGGPERSLAETIGGCASGGAALLAMGAGAFVPLALLALGALRRSERPSRTVGSWRELWPALGLLALAGLLWTAPPEHAELRARTLAEFFNALGRAAAWPHVWQPWAALGMNLPVAVAAVARLAGRRRAAPGEDFALLLAGWAVAAAGAMAWTRGHGSEFTVGVPSRYADFLVLLPLANAWCALALAREAAARYRGTVRLVATAWGVFLLLGWLGLSLSVLRHVIAPLVRERATPARLARQFQATGDPAVYAGQPVIFLPHLRLKAVSAVLNDERMRGALPPSLQPERPVGPLSRAVRTLLRRQ